MTQEKENPLLSHLKDLIKDTLTILQEKGFEPQYFEKYSGMGWPHNTVGMFVEGFLIEFSEELGLQLKRKGGTCVPGIKTPVQVLEAIRSKLSASEPIAQMVAQDLI